MELNPLLMNTEDLLRYSLPETVLEKALFEALQDFSGITLEEYEELKDQVSALDDELCASREKVEFLNQQVGELENRIEELEDELTEALG